MQGWATDLDEASRRIKQNQPFAVMVVTGDAITDCGPAIARLRAECPGVPIKAINVGIPENGVLAEEETGVQALRDLLSVVEGSQRLNASGNVNQLANR